LNLTFFLINKKENPDSEIEQAIELINNCGAMEYCESRKTQFVENAKNSIRIFPDSEANQDLIDIANFIIKRDI